MKKLFLGVVGSRGICAYDLKNPGYAPGLRVHGSFPSRIYILLLWVAHVVLTHFLSHLFSETN